MGREAICQVTHQKKTVEAKAQLEGDHVLIRGEELRLRIPVKDLRKVEAVKGALELDHASTGPVRLALGADAAPKWVQKILHPPSRLDKLGVKPGVTVCLEGRFEREFEREVEAAPQAKAAEADLVFAAADSPADLQRAAALAVRLQGKSAIWVVYPKGKGSKVTQEDVFGALRAAGVVDSKVCGFSATHTALKFVVPLSRRTPKPLK